MSLAVFVENVENNRCVDSIFGNQFHLLLMSSGLSFILSGHFKVYFKGYVYISH